MTLLRHEDLERVIDDDDLERRLVIMPLLDRAKQIGSASVDVRLGTEFRFLRHTEGGGIDPGEPLHALLEHSQERVAVAIGEPLWLHPGHFVLGATLEYLRFPPYLGGYVVGRSSWGRIGLLVATAIMVQPGFAGCLTLELANHGESPIALYAGSRIAQLAVHTLDGDTAYGYSGKYVGPTGPQASLLTKEQEEIQALHGVASRLGGEHRSN
jgi:dCTP deaminase